MDTKAPGFAQLKAIADVRLEQKNPQGAYTTAPYLYGAGNVNGVCHLAEALIKWDVSSLRGKSILSANLKLNITSTSASGQFAFFRLNKPWTEGGANWLQLPLRPLLGRAGRQRIGRPRFDGSRELHRRAVDGDPHGSVVLVGAYADS